MNQDHLSRKLRRNLGRLPFADDLVASYFAAFDSKTPMAAKAVLVGALGLLVAGLGALSL